MQTVEARFRALMTRAQAGDGGAYRALLSALTPHLRAYLGRRLAADPAEVEDVVQETVLAIHLKRDSYDPAHAFTPWVHAVARHKLIDALRRRKIRPGAEMEDAEDLWATSAHEGAMARRDLGRLLGTLPGKQADALRLTKLDGLSVEEAAQRTGMSTTAVKVSVHRGLKTLTARLRER